MKSERLAVGAIAGSAMMILISSSPVQGTATSPVATWEMNEPEGAAVMRDSSGNDVHGLIGTAVRTGTVYDGATGYRWPFTRPNEPPAKPERLVTVDDGHLNPGSGDYAITMRFRTTHSFGNMIQKGQSRNRGGFFKWQIPKGKLVCVFRGYDSDGNRLSKAVNSGSIPLNDGAWHVVRCERTSNRLTMTIDGERTRRARGPTGHIANDVPMTIGGKPNCDQIKVTCDYFAGDIDWIRIEKG